MYEMQVQCKERPVRDSGDTVGFVAVEPYSLARATSVRHEATLLTGLVSSDDVRTVRMGGVGHGFVA